MCGGTVGSLIHKMAETGLSPRVRGNPWYRRDAGNWAGSIPACAGEPLSLTTRQPKSMVYPRVCGGTASELELSPTYSGLSPRVRGNPGTSGGGDYERRSIPACAGEPRRWYLHARRSWVYPRVCGGTPWRKHSQNDNLGLSPRVRGNQLAHLPTGARNRSIPACAGEPTLIPANSHPFAVYPRVCGGTASTRPLDTARLGLSPRVRGNHQQHYRVNVCPRSIPACAGEPSNPYRWY